MATSADIAFAALMMMNIVVAVVFFLVFALLRIRARNENVFFSKWHVKGLQTPLQRETFLPKKFTKRNCVCAYFTSFNWIPAVLKVPEHMLIDHAGLDSAVYLRIYLTGLKILVPICVIVFVLVVPVNYTNRSIDPEKGVHFSGIEKLSILNVPHGSKRFWTHIIVAYAITFWTCYVLKDEYGKIASMRLDFMATNRRRPSRYAALVRYVPSDSPETVSEEVERFFKDNYPDHYLTHQLVFEASKLSDLMNEKKESQNKLAHYQQKYDEKKKRPTKRGTGFLGCLLCFKREDAIDFYTSEIERLNKKIVAERLKVDKTPAKYIKPAAFVFFKTEREAAVCAQTQQSRNPKLWPTEWAPEPCDVSWNNLAFSSVSLPTRRIVVICFGLLTFLSTIASPFIVSCVTINGQQATIPGFRSIADKTVLISSNTNAALPQILLKILIEIFNYLVEKMTIFLRLSSLSATERRNASWGYILNFINSFLLIIIPADGYKEIIHFLFQSPIKMAKEICLNLPKKDSFFIVYIMLGATGVAGEILRWKPFKRYFLDILFSWTKSQNSSYSSLGFDEEPDIQLYLLLALVYAVFSPLLLLSAIVFLALSYLVLLNQFINVYHQKYESAAAYWPDVHWRIIGALIVSQLLLMGFLSTQQQVYHAIPFILPLSIYTIAFYRYCKAHFEPVFFGYPMEEATKNDKLDQEDPITNLKDYLKNAYTNPVFKDEDEGDLENALETGRQLEQPSLVPTERQPQTYVSKRELKAVKTF